MNWRLFLESLQAEGGQLQLDGDDLVYNGLPKALTPDRLQSLKAHKAEIIDFIRQDFTLHPLSYGQKSLWFEAQLSPAGAGYNISVALRIHSALDWGALQKAFQQLVNRHAALRTTFAVVDGLPSQVVHRYLPAVLTAVDASTWTETVLAEQVAAAHKAPFDLAQGPLFRLHGWTQGDQAHVLLITLHHLIYDGWSNWILLDELQQLYKAALTKSKVTLPPLKAAYTDYVTWQQSLIEREGDRLWAYWREQLAGELPILDLPLDYARSTTSTYEGASLPITIPAELAAQLRLVAQNQGVTPYMLFLAAYQLLLQRHTGQDDIIVGSPMAGRSRPDFATIVGYFVSLVMLRGDLSGNPTFAQLLQQIRRTVLGAFEHQDFPFQLLVERLQPPRLPNRAPIYDAMFTMQQPQANLQLGDATAAASSANTGLLGESELMRWGELTISLYPLAQYGGAFDLFLELAQSSADTITGFLHYNPKLFAAATIERMAGHFLTLLAAIAANPHQPLAQIPLLTAAEREQLLVTWNTPTVDLHHSQAQAGQSIHQRFEAQAALTPDAIAVTLASDITNHESPITNHASPSLTYRELNDQANQLAHYLQTLGVGTHLGAETLVGLCVERSLEMVVAILAILKAGGAYVPLDPAYPTERLAFMLADSAMPVVLTQGHLLDRVAADGNVQVVDLETIALTAQPTTNLVANDDSPDRLAYIIYTSGSTGKPKGVLVTHQNVLRLFTATDHWYGFNHTDVWTLFHSYAFDFSVWELWGALLYGGRLVVVPYLVSRSPEAFYQLLCAEGVTVLNQTPSAFRQLIHAEEQIDKVTRRQGDKVSSTSSVTLSPSHLVTQSALALRYVIFGGEALDLASLQPWFARHGDAQPQLINMYGITETTVHVTYRPIRLADLATSSGGAPASVIGGPIPDLQLYILDQQQQPVPIGRPGELYVGGAGVSRGYLKRPELTAARFLPNPFGAGKLYRTGDLAKRLPDGDIEYLGRIDNQVKLRGFRIELGEIEAALLQHPAIREAVVIVREDPPQEKRLVAYLVAKDAAPAPELAPAALRQQLGQHLPDYMLPAAFVMLDRLPLTTNGKLDRKALPAPPTIVHTSQPGGEGVGLGQSPTTRVTPLQQEIMALWQAALQVPQVGIHDNFFELGGHSLLLLNVHSQLQPLVEARLQKTVAVVDLFRYPTIHALCDYLEPTARLDATAQPAVRATQATQFDAIAIVGMAGRFPGAASVAAFWQNLCAGIEAITPLSDDALLAAGVDRALLANPDYVKAASLLAEIEQFDADFFGFARREAELLDPQVRLFLECAWEALEEAGCVSEQYRGRIGVYAGSGLNAYLDEAELPRDEGSQISSALIYQAMTANGKDFLATRLSYKLNLTGPSITVQTACSTSLVAVHLAVQALRNGECDMALAGGVTVNTYQSTGYLYQEGMILSPDGHCRSFDVAANGTVSGSGVGIVVLKRLADALAEGDVIHAVIKGSAINNDGSTKVAFMAPSVDGQIGVIRQALANAQVAPASIAYIETHGTATHLGDQIELTALKEVFQGREQATAAPLVLGAVKTNVGHLDTAAGVTGLIKTTLALKHGVLPPTLHFTALNPQLNLPAELFAINTALQPWSTVNGTPRRAGVSAFGIGGTNAHLVLEEAPPQPVADALPHPNPPQFGEGAEAVPERSHHLLTLSAKSGVALRALAARYSEFLAGQTDEALGDLCYTSHVGRSHFAHRLTLTGSSTQVMAQKLAAFAQGLSVPELTQGVLPANPIAPKVAMLFTGQGSQYLGMGRALYETFPPFRRTLDQCDEIFQECLGRSLLDLLYAESESSDLMGSHPCGQAVNFALECALADLWRAWGITPDFVLGHSLGDFAAAYTAGVFALADGLRLVIERGRLMETADGDMLAVMAAESAVVPLLRDYPAVVIGVVNGPENIVLSGQRVQLAQVDSALRAAGFKTRKLAIPVAAHSPLLDPVLDQFAAAVAGIPRTPPTIPVVSSMSGALVTSELTDPAYWRQHLRNPVRFDRGVRTLQEAGCTIFIEIGPKPTLLGLVEPILERDDKMTRWQDDKMTATMLPSLRGQQPDWQTLLTSLGELYVRGVAIDWQGVDKEYRRRKVALPTYPFQRQRYWLARRNPSAQAAVATDAFAQLLADHTADGKLEQLADLLTRRAALAPETQGVVLKVLTALAAESRALPRKAKAKSMLYEVAWEAQPKPTAEIALPLPGRWLIVGDGGSVATALADQLTALGDKVDLVPATALADLAAGKRADAPPLRGVIYLGALAETLEPADSDALMQSQQRTLGTLVQLVQTLAGLPDQLPRLWVVTQGAQQLAPTEGVALLQSSLWGLGRTVTVEHSELWGGLIDLDPNASPAENAEQLVAELWPVPPAEPGTPARQGDGEEQIAYRQGQRYVARLAAVDPPNRADPVVIDPDALYLITGGLGQLGLENAQWLVDQGARHLFLLGRSGLQTAAQQARVDAWVAAGVAVQVAAVDVADEAAMTQLFAAIANGPIPLRGVIHAAGIGNFQPLQSLGWADLVTVLRPKVAGGWLLHRLTAQLNLDFFVAYSSGAGIWGSKQQAHYGAANHFLDGLMAYRRSLGLPGLSIAWGLWQPTALSAADAQALEAGFAAIGVRAFPAELGLAAQAQLLQSTASQVTVADVDWAQLQTFYTLTKPRRFLAKVAATQADFTGGADESQEALPTVTLRQQLEAAPVAERSALLLHHVRVELGNLLGIAAPETIDQEQGLMDLGLDSLLAVEIRNRLSKSLQQRLPATLIFDYPTLQKLVEYLQQATGLQWTAEDEPATAPSAPSPGQAPAFATLTELDEISDEEAADLLTAKLAQMGLA